MGNRKIKFTDEQITEIEQARKNNRDKNAERRLCVLSMKAQSKTLDEIVARTEYSPTHVRFLVTKYFNEGLEAVIGKKRQANRRNMPFEEEAALINDFTERAKKGELITVKNIKSAYEAKVEHKIGSGHIYMILKRHGWRKIKPRPERPKKASEAEIEASKKLTPA